MSVEFSHIYQLLIEGSTLPKVAFSRHPMQQNLQAALAAWNSKSRPATTYVNSVAALLSSKQSTRGRARLRL